MSKFLTMKRVIVIVLVLIAVLINRGVLLQGKPMERSASEFWMTYLAESDFIVQSLDVVTNDGFKLETEVFVPQGGSDQKPVVIFAGGSGDGLYQNYNGDFHQHAIIDYFHQYDISVVLYNKRGMGASEGNFYQNDYQGRADDIGAIIDVVKQLEFVDENHIGALGHSQGGWVVPLLVSQREDIAFWVTYAGPATSYMEQLEDFHETNYMCNGLKPNQIKLLIPLKLGITKAASALGHVLPIGSLGFDAHVYKYDPADVLEDLQVPGLMLFGENDGLVDPARNQAALERIFSDSDPEFITAQYIPSANHGFRVVEDMCTPYSEGLEQPIAPELFDVMDAWLESLGY